MKEGSPKTFEPVESGSDEPPYELRSESAEEVPARPSYGTRSTRPKDARGMMTVERRETIRSALLWITVAVLALAVFTFLLSVNSVISIWFRSQWAPVARSIAALAVIALCLYVMMRLIRRESGVPK